MCGQGVCATPQTLEYKKKSPKGLSAASKAVSPLTSAKRTARLAFDKANQEGRFSSERVEDAHLALNRVKEDMCPTQRRLEEHGVEY